MTPKIPFDKDAWLTEIGNYVQRPSLVPVDTQSGLKRSYLLLRECANEIATNALSAGVTHIVIDRSVRLWPMDSDMDLIVLCMQKLQPDIRSRVSYLRNNALFSPKDDCNVTLFISDQGFFNKNQRPNFRGDLASSNSTLLVDIVQQRIGLSDPSSVIIDQSIVSLAELVLSFIYHPGFEELRFVVQALGGGIAEELAVWNSKYAVRNKNSWKLTPFYYDCIQPNILGVPKSLSDLVVSLIEDINASKQPETVFVHCCLLFEYGLVAQPNVESVSDLIKRARESVRGLEAGFMRQTWTDLSRATRCIGNAQLRPWFDLACHLATSTNPLEVVKPVAVPAYEGCH